MIANRAFLIEKTRNKQLLIKPQGKK